MNAIELLLDFFLDMKRLGPGSNASTLMALNFIEFSDDKRLRIADIGCGTGAQTLVLARSTNSLITAVDILPEFLESLEKRSAQAELCERISTIQCSMDNLPFQAEEFDIVWSEASIYNVGFRKGLEQWRRFIKPGGYIVVSDISWMRRLRPDEIESYWMHEYPEIDTVSSKINGLEEAGYSPVAHFALSPDCWMENYYTPVQRRFASFLDSHSYSPEARALVDDFKREISYFEEYGDYFNYVFYIGRRT